LEFLQILRCGIIQRANEPIHFRGRVGWLMSRSALMMTAHFLGVADGLRPFREEDWDGLFRSFLVGGVVATERVFDRALGSSAIHQIGAGCETDKMQQQPKFKTRRRMRQRYLARGGKLQDVVQNPFRTATSVSTTAQT